MDFVVYGEGGLHALEVKNSSQVRPGDLRNFFIPRVFDSANGADSGWGFLRGLTAHRADIIGITLPGAAEGVGYLLKKFGVDPFRF